MLHSRLWKFHTLEIADLKNPQTAERPDCPTNRSARGSSNGTKKRGLRRYIGPKRVAILLVLLAMAWYLRRGNGFDFKAITLLVQAHPTGAVLIFIAAYALSVAAVVPTLPLNLAAGVVWGAVWGGLLSALGASIGCVLAFAIARYLIGQPLARHFDNNLIRWIQDELLGKGWKFVAFLRVNPVVPTGPVNYLFGLTSIGIVPYATATICFITPPSLLVAWIGSAAGDIPLTGTGESVWHATLAISAAVTLAMVMRYALKYFYYSRGSSK
jgi:uncharacterized membrane protein YdjX (TVP38/TMEM64 family)